MRSPRAFGRAVLAVCCGFAVLAGGLPMRAMGDSLGETVREMESSLRASPVANAAGVGSTTRYAEGLLVAALEVFEQSRHLDKPYFRRGDGIDGRPGLYNPDNIYSSALLSDHGQYRVRGRRGSHAILTLQVLDAYPMVALGRNLAVIDLDAMGIQPGESFELLLGGARRSGRWIPLPSGSRALLVRQTFSDWQRETPTVLAIERLDRDAPPVDSGVPGNTATDYLRAVDRTWNADYLPMLQRLPENRLPPPRQSDVGAGGLGGQQSVSARYRLGPDRALLITVKKSAARYQGIQLGDPWFVTPNYVDHQVSLTSAQAVADADGHFRFVISLRDPGVANWLDPVGFAEGYLFMRWQGLERALMDDEAPVAENVDLADLWIHLPAGTHRVTPEARREQLLHRQWAPIRQMP
ncbi:MAG TPA: hypothetical protein PKZ77_06420 [Pseudomonadales bacterium]|nr:hypothetical protein [Pseudomonadales bacterium]